MSKATTLMAQRIVSKLLGEDDYASPEDYESRPGGPRDPYRQTTVKLAFKKKDFTGKRGTKPVAAEPKGKRIGDGSEFMRKRFNISFAEGVGEWAREKADLVKEIVRPQQSAAYRKFRLKELVGLEPDKKKKTAKGQAVASKPGKVSYREALMQHVLEKLKMKKAGKGAVVAKKPGAVKYCKEQFQDYAPPQRGDWDAFWEQVRAEALESLNTPDDPDSKEFLETVRYYVEMSETAAPVNFEEALQSPETWSTINPASLRQQWEQSSEAHAEVPEEAPDFDPNAPEPAEPTRAAPPGAPEPGHGVFGESKTKSRAKRLLRGVAKSPGPVRYGKK